MNEETKNTSIFEKAIMEIVREYFFDPETDDFIKPYAHKVLKARSGHILNNFSKRYSSGQPIPPSELREIIDAINESGQMETLIFTKEVSEALYERTYKAFRDFYSSSETETWQDLFTEISPDESFIHEIFVRLVEEQEKIEITSAKQLQDITGITHIYGYWDAEKGETVPYEPYEGKKIVTEKQAQVEAYEQVEETFTKAMQFRYERFLKERLRNGDKYKDLLEVNPSSFYLPDDYKETAIKRAVSQYFELWDTSRLKPDFGSIADKINATYSFVIDASKQSFY
jgi:hypothetical protein